MLDHFLMEPECGCALAAITGPVRWDLWRPSSVSLGPQSCGLTKTKVTMASATFPFLKSLSKNISIVHFSYSTFFSSPVFVLPSLSLQDLYFRLKCLGSGFSVRYIGIVATGPRVAACQSDARIGGHQLITEIGAEQHFDG